MSALFSPGRKVLTWIDCSFLIKIPFKLLKSEEILRFSEKYIKISDGFSEL